MKKFPLLLLDANVVILLFEEGIWEQVVGVCDIHLAATVVGEAKYYEDRQGCRHRIDLASYERRGVISIHSEPVSSISSLKARFGADILDRLDDGEAESLAIICRSSDEFNMCSSDHIVFRILGALGVSERGISLAEVLQVAGLARQLPRQFTKEFRDEWTKKGFTDGIQGFGMKS